MAIRVRPITSEDVKKISSGYIRNAASEDMSATTAGTVVDKELFGKVDSHRMNIELEFEDEYTRSPVISLTIPVLNPFLAGRDFTAWKTILKRDVVDIALGNVVFNNKTKKEVTRDHADGISFSDVLIGGQYLRKLINEFDIDKEIIREIYHKFVYNYLSTEQQEEFRTDGIMYGEIIKGEGKVDLVNGYSYNPSIEISEAIKDIEEGVDETLGKCFESSNSRLAYLFAFKTNSKFVVDQIMDYVFVLPIGYRPTIDNRVDPLTRQYNNLVKINNELRDNISYSGSQLKSVLLKYEKMVKQIIHIFVGEKSLEPYSKNFKSLTDTLGGKNGLIRDKMQGTRTDYSGRCVITCDPFMSIDTIGVPRNLLNKLIEFEIVKEIKKSKPDSNLSYLVTDRNIEKMRDKAVSLAEGSYILTGRQPTLWFLGMQALKVKVVEGNAIVLSPLVVMPFNADFDGDQMWLKALLTDLAKKDARELLASTENLYYPGNGEITVIPRHEILYGLYMCSTEKTGDDQRHITKEDITEMSAQLNIPESNTISIVYEAVCRQIINIYDIIDVSTNYSQGLSGKTAGIWALKAVTGKKCADIAIGGSKLTKYSAGGEDSVVTTEWFKKIFEYIGAEDKLYFVDTVNKMTKLGFCVAKVWSPSISTINDIDVTPFIDKFNREISKREELLNMGIEIESAYTSFFNRQYSLLMSEIEKYVVDSLGQHNGYIKMWKSGAKGNKSNIVQLFATKGRIKKDDVTAFNTIIRNSLSNQLTGLEHFITAYGSRDGIKEKVLATADPGYLTRKLEHAAAQYVIVTEDCGTENGITFRYKDILPFIDEVSLSSSDSVNVDFVEDLLAPMLVGRVILPNNVYVEDEKHARSLFRQHVAEVDASGKFVDKGGIKMRSPITCTCPVCQKCYGYDYTKRTRYSKIGKPIGFVASQAIGQPGTQLTMKNFQRGGVMSEANLTSSFSKINKYFHLYTMQDERSRTLTYDALSPVNGYVSTVNLGDGTKSIIVSKDKYNIKNLLGVRNYIVPEGLRVKDVVRVGDSFQEVQGDLDIREVIKYRGFEDAYKYLILQLYKVFSEESIISLKHFEVIVAAMCSFVVVEDAPNLGVIAGEVLSMPELHDMASKSVIKGYHKLHGIKSLPKFRRDFFESMFMEDMTTFVPRAAIMHPKDSVTNPKTQLSFGSKVTIGSGF